MAQDTKDNDVWSTLTSLGGQYISAKRDVNLARASVQTRSSPSGTDDRVTPNPFPGTQGAYPQAEAKMQISAPGGAFNISGNMFALIAAAVLLFVFVMVRK